ncbi:hypothetical protein QJS66_01910 [Kocuria rhizophila]|nr:hypothetical protein QJS66_01910 [Kocuria rhizophila]
MAEALEPYAARARRRRAAHHRPGDPRGSARRGSSPRPWTAQRPGRLRRWRSRQERPTGTPSRTRAVLEDATPPWPRGSRSSAPAGAGRATLTGGPWSSPCCARICEPRPRRRSTAAAHPAAARVREQDRTASARSMAGGPKHGTRSARRSPSPWPPRPADTPAAAPGRPDDGARGDAGTTTLRQPVWAVRPTQGPRSSGGPHPARAAPRGVRPLGLLGVGGARASSSSRGRRPSRRPAPANCSRCLRVARRHVLAHRLGCRPDQVPVTHDPRTGAPRPVHGRAASSPAWTTPPSRPPRRLGVGARAARPPPTRAPAWSCSSTAQRRVGVDAERIQSDVGRGALLHAAHPADRSGSRGCGGGVEPRTSSWVRVEALSEGVGSRLSRDPAGIRISRRRAPTTATGGP